MPDNNLLNLLLQRHMQGTQPGPPPPQMPSLAQPPPVAPGPPQAMPAVPPSPHAHIPPEAQRWQNAQQMQQAIANNWSPNPTILQASLSKG